MLIAVQLPMCSWALRIYTTGVAIGAPREGIGEMDDRYLKACTIVELKTLVSAYDA